LVRRSLIVLLHQPQMVDEYGPVGGMRIGRGNRSTRRKPAPVPLCSLKIPSNLTLDGTRAAAVGSRRLTTWAMARPHILFLLLLLLLVGWDQVPRYCGHFGPIVQAPDDRWGWLWSNWWNEDWQGKPKYSEKKCPSATLSTTTPTWPDPSSNPGRRGRKPATNRLSYGTVGLT
jgi:hypothetical protein